MALKGTNQELGRPFNRRIVLEAIRLQGPIARNDIARRVGLTVQTVSTIVRELEDDGFILSTRERPKGRGVPPTSLEINPVGGFAIGVQINPLAIQAALINLSGTVIAQMEQAVERVTPDAAFDIVASLVAALKADQPDRRILGVGLALPGPFGVESMSFVGPTTLAGWQGVDIRNRLEAVTDLPVFLETDMAAAALGEQLYGYGTELKEYYFLFFGVGLGGAMVHDGAVLRGNWGNAGELGHITAVPDGELCPCGNRGCLERYVSLDALLRRGIPELDWVREITPIFARAIRTIENLFDPQAVVLGGLASESVLAGLAAAAEQLGNSIATRKDRTVPRIIVARGGNSVLRGAAALAVHGALSPHGGQMFADTPTDSQEEVMG
ncbi:ROK family transcriptional regulator [Devosia sp.]|uniref:ROK family transcriptional regulator n=1 Tax=Devosia sp. TaxID=1871048 RepID=UPI0032651378